MKISVIDTETTDKELDEHNRVVEVAGVDLTEDYMGLGREWSYLVNPGVPIPPQAQAVHHISDDDVRDAYGINRVLGEEPSFVEAGIFVAHNAKFEHHVLKDHLALFRNPMPRFLCTMRLAKHLWPDAPGFGNQVLRYWRKLDVPPLDLPPHRALPDAIVTAVLFQDILKESKLSVPELLVLQHKPAILQTMPFGKHRGEPMDQLPRSYYRWVLHKSDIDDQDIVHTIRTHFENGEGTNG